MRFSLPYCPFPLSPRFLSFGLWQVPIGEVVPVLDALDEALVARHLTRDDRRTLVSPSLLAARATTCSGDHKSYLIRKRHLHPILRRARGAAAGRRLVAA